MLHMPEQGAERGHVSELLQTMLQWLHQGKSLFTYSLIEMADRTEVTVSALPDSP